MKQSSIEDGEQQIADAGGYQSIEPEVYRQQQDEETPPLLEIPEEIYAVRKAALKVLKPLNNTWVSFRFILLNIAATASAAFVVLTINICRCL